jgi:lipopolysaccharide transport system permease protein
MTPSHEPACHPQEWLTTITPATGASASLLEMWHERELLAFLALRDVSVRYKQTILGAAWAFLQPLLTAVVFSVFFGRLAKMPSDGVPYELFSYAGLLIWTFFSSSVSQGSLSLVNSVSLFTKVFFPRMFIPLACIATAGLDFLIAAVPLAAMMAWYGWSPPVQIVLLPVVLAFAVVVATGVSVFLAAVAVRFRDVRYAVPFGLQLMLFLSPIAYPASIVPAGWRWLWACNPMVGVVEAFRWAVLGTPVEPAVILPGVVVGALVFWAGLNYFRTVESSFADVA